MAGELRAFDHGATVVAPAAPQVAKAESFALPNNAANQFSVPAPGFGGSGTGGGAPGRGGNVPSIPPLREVRPPHVMSPAMPVPHPVPNAVAPPPGGGPAGPGGLNGAGNLPPGGNGSGGYVPPMGPLGMLPAPGGRPPAFSGANSDAKLKRHHSVANEDLHVTGPAGGMSLRKLDPSIPAVERDEDLKRDGDRAAKYATDRAATLAPAVDAYLAVAGRQPASLAVQRYAAQQARVVAAPVPPLVVREYAAARPEPAPVPDAGAPDTVLWQPVIVLPAAGTTALNFHLGDLPGGYQLMIAGHTADGRLGATRGIVTVVPGPTPAPIGPGAPAGAIPPAAPVAPGPR
ncbi:hypothetical protein FTUN_2396 [Frigoriglobus tundricola]|uniref:Uncharacterized protein n=2 Tax=Frigoriglobus tundricola TaxID=2774151 RepID=A0A6M5YND6_9BACT|nr:hypothetical protein FTUN_2396 [Frigoriglobus tundricola]